MADIFYKYEGNKYGSGILLNEYNNEFSLVAANQKDDQTFMEWVFPQKKDGSKTPIDKALPWKIKLGNKEESVKILKFFIDVLEDKANALKPPDYPDGLPETEDDIPF